MRAAKQTKGELGKASVGRKKVKLHMNMKKNILRVEAVGLNRQAAMIQCIHKVSVQLKKIYYNGK